MQISIIGTGSVGTALGKRWAEMDHKIIFGSRNPSSNKVLSLQQTCKNSKAVDISQAIKSSNIIILATPWSATLEIVEKNDFKDKTIIDCTNPLQSDFSPIQFPDCKSGAEIIADKAPGAHVVKAFNTTGSGNMLDAMFGIEQATMFICGDDITAKKTAKLLAIELGFEVVDAGKITSAQSLEALAILWINLAYQQQLGPNIAFKLLKR